MRFVVVLALLCYCYAAEQTTPTTQQEVHRLPPQYIKDFVEQHIKYVKQQIPNIQQHIKEGRHKVEIQKPPIKEDQLSEHRKEFIKAHITQVLKYIYEQREKNRPQISLNTAAPAVSVQKIEKLKEDIKDVKQPAEKQENSAVPDKNSS